MSNESAIERCCTCLTDTTTMAWVLADCLPVPYFGSLDRKKVKLATVGINPSSTEFYAYKRLKPESERLPALPDFGARERSQLTAEDVANAKLKRVEYFTGQARQTHEWFGKLGEIVKAASSDWSYEAGSAVHLDIVACVTTQRWSKVEGKVQKQLTGNCRKHLEVTLSALSPETMLLLDGKTACEALAGIKDLEWIRLCEFLDDDGRRKSVRVRRGMLAVAGAPRQYASWNIPANHLSEDALARVGDWVRGVMGT